MRYYLLFAFGVCFLSLSVRSDAQDAEKLVGLGWWNLTSVAGEVKAGALYGQTGSSSYGFKDYAKTTNYYGGLSLRTNSYFWDPNFLTLGVEGGYFPQTLQDQFLIYPNRYDVINTKNLHINSALFPKKPITLGVFANFDQMYDTRENLTDIKTDGKSLGSFLAIGNKFAPLSFDYSQNEWHQKELQTDRNFNYLQNIFNARVSKTFRKNDRNELLYSHREYSRQDYNLSPVFNIADNLELHNNYYIDSAKKSRLSSNIVGISQRGIDTFKQVHASEGFFYNLPHNFTLNTNYSFYYVTRPTQDVRQHDLNVNLGHQLYESLYTGVSGDLSYVDQTEYKEQILNLGVNILYNKKILRKGLLSVSYNYNRLHDKRQSKDELLQVVSEPYLLNDNEVVMLKLPFVDLSTVTVKDVTGFYYQKDSDYVLIQRNNYLEIRRIPGRLIPNNGTVYVSYTATQPGNSKYDINLNSFSIDISFFRRLIGVYYKIYNTDYVNVENVGGQFLNYLTNEYYGVRSEYKFVSAGAEVNNYRSSLYPYRMLRYFLTVQGSAGRKFRYSANGNIRTYDHLQNGEMNRQYNDVNGMIAYTFTPATRLDFNGVYTYQHGQSIDLNMITGKLKLTTVFRDITCIAGVEAYKRMYLSSQTYNYLGGFIQLVKKFKY
jgi:hypothetical protein